MTTWILSWDDTGLESVVNATELECQETFQRLSEGHAPDSVMRILRMLQLRSRLNSQRNYEIWIVETTGEINETFIREQFTNNMSAFKDLIRRKGIKQFV